MLRRDGIALRRLLHPGDEPCEVRAWVSGGAVRLRASAASAEAVEAGLERMRFALCLDHDLSDFHHRFRRDPVIGPVVRVRPWTRPRRRPEPFEALAWAICEQLIEGSRAVDIQRALVRSHGRRSACGRLRDAPSAELVADRSPAELERCGLSPKRAITMLKAAREVASGRADLSEHEPSWRRLRRIKGLGSWTLEKLAYEGQGRDDKLPAGDLDYLKVVGRLAGLGRRATESEVRDFFAPYAPYEGLAGTYVLSAAHWPVRGT